jgi:hypothetical protein
MMRRHPLDPVSLVAGLAFTGIGLVFLLGDATLAVRLRWTWPILLVSLGVGILLRLLVPSGRAEPTPAPGLREPEPTAGLPEPTVQPWEPTAELDAGEGHRTEVLPGVAPHPEDGAGEDTR